MIGVSFFSGYVLRNLQSDEISLHVINKTNEEIFFGYEADYSVSGAISYKVTLGPFEELEHTFSGFSAGGLNFYTIRGDETSRSGHYVVPDLYLNLISRPHYTIIYNEKLNVTEITPFL